MPDTSLIVNKAWNYAHVLRDDGLGHGIGVSERYYLQVPGDLYDRASSMNACENGVSGQQRTANALQRGAVPGRTKPLLALASESARSGEVA